MSYEIICDFRKSHDKNRIGITYWHYARSSSTRLREDVFIFTEGSASSLFVEY